jgi:hypothetical protein
MDEKFIYDMLKKEHPTWSEGNLRIAAANIAANPKVLEAGAGGLGKVILNLVKTIKKPTKKQAILGGGALGVGGLAVQGGGDSDAPAPAATPDVAAQANADLLTQAAAFQSTGGDINALLNTPAGQQLIKNPNFNIGSIMNSGNAYTGTSGVYTGKPITVSQYEWGSGGAKPKTTVTDTVSLMDWKNQFPIADPKALAQWKSTLVAAGVVSASAGLPELKQQWEAWGQASQDAGRQGQKLSPYQLLDIQRGLWGGGTGGRDYSTQYQVNLLKEENVKSMYKAAREQEAGLIVGDEQAAAFAERIKARQMAKPTKTEYKKIKGKMTPVVTPGFGEAETAAAALELAKKDPLYAEFQTANVFGSALEKALGVRP